MNYLLKIAILIVCTFLTINAQDNLEVLRFDEEILIKSENKNYFLDNPRKIIECNKLLVILDNSSPYIKIFDLNGKFIKSFGIKGKAPGEFLAPILIEFLAPILIKSYADSLLYIYDWKRMELSVFTINGNCLKNFKFNDRIREFELLKKNQIVYSMRNLNKIRLNEASDYKIFLYRNSQNILLDSIKVDDKIWFEKRRLMMSLPFIRERFFYLNKLNNIIIIDNESFQFKIFESKDLSFHIKEHIKKIGPKITKKDQNAYFNTKIIVDPEGNRLDKIPIDIRNAIKFPIYKPRIASIIYDSNDDYVWLKLYSEEKQYDKYDIFHQDGVYLKTVLIEKSLLKNPLMINQYYFLQVAYLDGLPVIKKYSRQN